MEVFITSLVEKSLSVAILVVVFLRFERWCREQIKNEREDKTQALSQMAAVTAKMTELVNAVKELTELVHSVLDSKADAPKRRKSARSRITE